MHNSSLQNECWSLNVFLFNKHLFNTHLTWFTWFNQSYYRITMGYIHFTQFFTQCHVWKHRLLLINWESIPSWTFFSFFWYPLLRTQIVQCINLYFYSYWIYYFMIATSSLLLIGCILTDSGNVILYPSLLHNTQ